MLTRTHLYARGVHRAVRLMVFGVPSLLAVFLLGFPGPGNAQLPTPEQLQQLQQMQQQYGQPGANANLNQVQPSLVLQPDMGLQSGQQNQQNPLPPSRLEQIMSARAGIQMRQFGYDQMGVPRSVTVPQTGAVQDDYVLGSGDEIVVSLRGQENNEIRTTVDRNGQVLLQRLNPISATGRSFGSFRQDVEAAVRRAFVATNAYVSVARVRQVSVLVSGEVNNPGQRLVTGLASVVDAILLSGGVKKSGSLRNVRLQRGSRQYVVDLYSVLTDRGAASNLRLADGDRIVVPLLGKTASVAGLVRRPGIYELPSGQDGISVSALMALAGGQEVRGRYRLSLLQMLPDGRSSLAAVQGESGTVRDSEILFVQLGADLTINQATLGGGTGLAGAGPIVQGTQLSQWLRAPGALGNSPYTLFGILVRKDPQTLLRTLLPFTPAAILAGREDRPLQSDDFIRPLSNNEAQLLMFVVRSYLGRLAVAQAAIRNPLSQARSEGDTSLARTLQDQAGEGAAPLDDVSSVPADIQRREIIPLLMVGAPGSPLARREEALQAEREADAQARRAIPGTQQPTSGNFAPPAVSPSGSGMPRTNAMAGNAINNNYDRNQDRNYRNQDDFGGERTQPAPNFIEQVAGANQFAGNREIETFGQLVQQLGVDPLILINFLVDHRVRLEGAVQGPGYYLAGPSVTVTDLVQAAGGTVNWADDSGVELISTMVDRQNGKSVTQRTTLPRATMASYTLRPRDQIRYGQVFADVGVGSVTIQGEVRNPGTFTIIRGEHLSDILARAGGLSSTAYPYGTVFLRRSAAETERDGYMRAANEVQNQLVVAMTRIGNDRVDPSAFASMQTFVSELRNQRALGRISVAADPSVLAANPSLDPLMEAGDVIYIPPRPNSVSVLGQVLQPGSYPYQARMKLRDYIQRAGGYATTADESQTFVVMPDGSARRVERAWLDFSPSETLPPGSTIVVPRDVTPLDLRQVIIDISQVFSQFAVAIASVAVLSKQ